MHFLCFLVREAFGISHHFDVFPKCLLSLGMIQGAVIMYKYVWDWVINGHHIKWWHWSLGVHYPMDKNLYCKPETRGGYNKGYPPKLFRNKSVKSHLPITSFLVVQSFWNFSQSTAVILLCSVKNFKMIGWWNWMYGGPNFRVIEFKMSQRRLSYATIAICLPRWYVTALQWCHACDKPATI